MTTLLTIRRTDDGLCINGASPALERLVAAVVLKEALKRGARRVVVEAGE